MKLRELLNELTENEAVEFIKVKIPGVKDIKKWKNAKVVSFEYKGIRFKVNFNYKHPFVMATKPDWQYDGISRKKIKEINDIVDAMNIKEVKQKTKEIKDTATKLPKKKFRL